MSSLPPDLPRCVHSGLKAAVSTGSLEQIQEADWFQYRYLSLDRPNLQFVAKECSTEMTEPLPTTPLFGEEGSAMTFTMCFPLQCLPLDGWFH